MSLILVDSFPPNFNEARTMPLVTFDQGFGLGLAVGVVVMLVITLVVSVLVLRSSDSAGLGQWKLNIDTPLPSMWMNVGYWKDGDGQPIKRFPEACAALLHQILDASGILIQDHNEKGLAVLDLGYGCGDQTWELAELVRTGGWAGFRYVGLSLDKTQVMLANLRLCREFAAKPAREYTHGSTVRLFCADAAKPETWTPAIAQSVAALADENFTERWLLALDCIYHFSPSRRPVLQYAAQNLKANYMAFDLLLNDTSSTRDTLVARAIGVMMGCPWRTFLTEQEYIDQLVECGYERKTIVVREITENVFPGLVKFIDRQDSALGDYGLSLGGFKLAQRIFDWFSRTRVVRAVIVVAPVLCNGVQQPTYRALENPL
ncbi:hypothetical protein S40288_05115 [Stachybotrys chartarum IBT 40288]|nr:hypothetical protein S40288_05115 [Stachybotrys chartarum IBT 40288]